VPDRPLRIGHLTTVDMSLALLLRVELEEAVAAGHTVVGLSAPGPYVAEVERLEVEHVPIRSLTRSWDLRSDLRAVAELARTLRRLDLDVLHTHNPKTGVFGRLVGRLVGVPVVVNTCHGLWLRPGDPLRKRVAVLAVEAAAAAFSHAELYQNADDHRALRRWVRGARSEVVGNGTDLERFRPDPVARREMRTELGVADDELLVAGVGRRVAEKGLPEFGAMAQALAGKARFVWVGPPDEDKPDAMAEDVPGVQLVGTRHDMHRVYNAMDVFVLPSHREGFSRSGMEAAATGLPLVLTDIRGCREIARNEREGLLVPPTDVDALTAAVERLLAEPELRAALGEAARAKALREFDQREIARASRRTYERVARRRGLGWGKVR
jgi:glycosyltransferase involved in cell wall biosynthesis